MDKNTGHQMNTQPSATLTAEQIERYKADLTALEARLGNRTNNNDIRISLCDLALAYLAKASAEPVQQSTLTTERLTMEQIERYYISVGAAHVDGDYSVVEGRIYMRPSPDGAWVRYSDLPAQAKASLGAEPVALTFDAFRAANKARCVKWHPAGIASWSPSDWLTAVTGELGELASLLKMRNRERDGLAGNKFSPTDKMIADELADVLTYLDLLAEVIGVNLGLAAVSKFNEVSERVGFPDRINIATSMYLAKGTVSSCRSVGNKKPA